jgi:pimeloyl-ACP methyl ester carboxylesterase
MTTTVQPTDVMITANGMNFHYLDWGNEGAPVMLLLHGLRGHCRSWDDVSARFCVDYHVMALDQRGRGETDWAPRGDYSTDAFVADLEEFCYTVGIERFTLVGHSMGGRNSMAFGGRNPQMLEKLVIVDIGPEIDPAGSARITREVVEVPEEFDSFEDAFQHVNSQNRFALEAVMRRRLTYQTKELANGKIGWRYDPEIREQRRNGTGAPPPDLWAPLSKVTCPTLIVRGSDTDTLGLSVAERMVEILADGKLVHVDNAAHMVFEDNPEGFIAALADFLG